MSFEGRSRAASYALAVLSMISAMALLVGLRGYLPQTPIALALLLIVLPVATLRGSRPALVSAVLGALGFNFFFLPPYGTLFIADAQNWIALAAFLITALTVGWLSSAAKRRAEEAEAGQSEIKRLYEELRASFQLASRAEALRVFVGQLRKKSSLIQLRLATSSRNPGLAIASTPANNPAS
jgi:two-component system sensor histidine kinase KdpD